MKNNNSVKRIELYLYAKVFISTTTFPISHLGGTTMGIVRTPILEPASQIIHGINAGSQKLTLVFPSVPLSLLASLSSTPTPSRQPPRLLLLFCDVPCQRPSSATIRQRNLYRISFPQPPTPMSTPMPRQTAMPTHGRP